MPPNAAARPGTLVVNLRSPDELFVGRTPGQLDAEPPEHDLDAVGACLGDPGVVRLLRSLHASPESETLVLRIGGAGPAHAEARAKVEPRLRVWARCRIAANRLEIRTALRAGARASAGCLCLLATAMACAWALQSESVGGPPGPLRSVLAESLVIAGWVAMWRPLEMLLFDPVRYRVENRLLRRLLRMSWRVEAANDPSCA
jgi:hypothetical protein